MGQALVLNQHDVVDVSDGSLSTERARDFFAEAPPLVPIEGVDPMPGESWRAYAQRVGRMLHRKPEATVLSSRQLPAHGPGTVCLFALIALVTLAVLGALVY